jgi:hypothetical protein
MLLNHNQKEEYIRLHLFNELRWLLNAATEWSIQKQLNLGICGYDIQVYAMDSAFLHARALFEFFVKTKNSKNHYSCRDFLGGTTLVKIETGRGHTPLFHDVEVTSYSFKVADGTVYVADSHNRALDVTLNGHTKVSFEKDGHVGDFLHILDDSGKDRKLHIVGKTAPMP